MIKNKIDLEEKYKDFLIKMGLDEAKMHVDQKTQIKQTFMATFGMALVTLKDEIGTMESEDDAIVVLEDILDQIKEFFLKTYGKLN